MRGLLRGDTVSQSKKMSAVESSTNIAVGVVVSLLSQIVIFWLYAIPVSFSRNVQMTAWFTVVSFIRSYSLRRFFNRVRG